MVVLVSFVVISFHAQNVLFPNLQSAQDYYIILKTTQVIFKMI